MPLFQLSGVSDFECVNPAFLNEGVRKLQMFLCCLAKNEVIFESRFVPSKFEIFYDWIELKSNLFLRWVFFYLDNHVSPGGLTPTKVSPSCLHDLRALPWKK